MDKPVTIMPCLDMRDGRVVKGIHFVDIRDAGDPVQCARAYCETGAGALALLDITATTEKRATLLDVVRRVAEACSVPFTVGGGIRDAASAEAVLAAGADRVSLSSAIFRDKRLLPDLIRHLGAEKLVAAIDVDRNKHLASGYEVFIDGGRTATGVDALEWIRTILGHGIQCLLPTSKATDGARTGFDLALIEAIAGIMPRNVDLVASGGAGKMEHFLAAARAGATTLLAASVFHFGTISIPDLKEFLHANGVVT